MYIYEYIYVYMYLFIYIIIYVCMYTCSHLHINFNRSEYINKYITVFAGLL